MIVRLPEFNLAPPSWPTVWAYARATLMAAAIIIALVGLAQWRSTGRFDRDSLEKLAKAATVPASVAGKGQSAAR